MEANAKTYEPGGDSALRLAACCGPLSSPRGQVKPPRLSPWKLAPPTASASATTTPGSEPFLSSQRLGWGSETDASGDDEDHLSTTSSVAPKDERSLLHRINKRTSDIQRLLRCLVTERHQHPLNSLSLAERRILEDGVGDGDDVEAPVARLLGTTIGSSLLVVSGLNLHDRTIFIDPVAGGCISAAKMDQVTSQFFNIMNRFSPLEATAGSLVNIDDPFLRSCMVRFVTCTQTGAPEDQQAHRASTAILEANLAKLSSCNPSRAIIIGLLALSLCPTSGFEPRLIRTVDGLGAAGRAMEFARAMGLDDAPNRARQETVLDLLSGSWLQPLRDDIVLVSAPIDAGWAGADETSKWYLVAHRSSWVDMYSTPAFNVRPTGAPDIGSVLPIGELSQLKDPILMHLALEARLLSLVAPVSAAFQRLRHDRSFEVTKATLLRQTLTEYEVEVRKWREDVATSSLTSAPFLILNSLQLEVVMNLKISTDGATHMPSPLGYENRSLLFLSLARSLLTRCEEVVRFVNSSNIDLGLLPGFQMTLSFAPLEAIVMAHRITGAESLSLSSSDLVAYRNRLIASHPAAESMVRHMDESLPSSGWKYALPSCPSASSSFSGLGPHNPVPLPTGELSAEDIYPFLSLLASSDWLSADPGDQIDWNGFGD
ncbi:hypothetical protein JCM24511_03864 [Saitozyma sp. JCM 24511]|nr:hypothetical protein JCM24511_03864 [Saitozyma sp. JCM 24511]